MLFDPDAHESLRGGSWDARAARRTIGDIVDDALAAFDGRGWPRRDGEIGGGVYSGAAGVVYTLRTLGVEPPLSEDALLAEASNDTFISGALGIGLIAFPQDTGVADRVEAAARAMIESGENELCSGAAGAVVVAMHLFDATRDERWASVVASGVEALWSSWAFDRELRACIWTQRRKDGIRRFLGAAHGLAGNVHALLRAAPFQSPDHQRELLDRVVETLTRSAVRERGAASWPDRVDRPDPRPRVQWCHGAPGIVVALAHAPRHRALDELLVEGGELTWRAGPLRKGYGLCHGTAGNGYAFLKLHRRTRDAKWLDRARRFAMHAVAQYEAREASRYALFTGDPGLALYLRACIDVDERFPLLDVV